MIDLPLHPFFDSFLHLTVFIFSSTALIILNNFISPGGLLSTYPPEGPLELLTKLFSLSFKKSSKKGCNGKSIKCITHNLWDDLETHINNFFERNTLKDILFKETRYEKKELN